MISRSGDERWKVFVFKQKTAYEMRISDWSSDVCSSDLQEHAPEEQHGEQYVAPLGNRNVAGLERDQQQPGEDRRRARAIADEERERGDSGDQIGRAPWRERVCPYV